MNKTICKPLVKAIAVASFAGFAATAANAQVTPFAETYEGLPVADGGTSLSDIGWLAGGEVFSGLDASGNATGYQFGYYDNDAPNGGPSFSSVATGDGHPGATDASGNYLNIYSDYNCCDLDVSGNEIGHGNGTDIHHALVHKNFTIATADIGGQVVFTFTYKRPEFQDDGFGGDTSSALGNGCDANPASYATGDYCSGNAFVKTLDPNAGFSTTNYITVDVNSASQGAWTTDTITLDLTDPLLDGQLLQVGFENFSQDFNNTGVYYDNISVEVNNIAAPVSVPVPAVALALLAGLLGVTVAARRSAIK